MAFRIFLKNEGPFLLKVTCYSSLYQLLEALLLGWYVGGMPVLRVLVFALASHIRTLGYLLGMY